MSEIWRRIQYLLFRNRIQRELEEELAAHRAQMSEPQSFGSTLKIREDSNEVWGFGWLERLLQDLRYAVRLMRRSPGFTLTAISVLAFGIGLNVAAFGLLNTVMFRPLPGIRDPHRLVRMWRKSPEGTSSNTSYPAFDFYRRNNQVFSSMLALSSGELSFGESERWKSKFVTRNFFETLGAGAAYGRLVATEPGDVVLSSAFFERRFGADVSMLGKPILLNRKAARIVGVAAADFQGLDPEGADAWARVEDHPHFFEGSSLLTSYEMQPMHIYGRLSPGVSPSMAEEALRPLVDERRKLAPLEIWNNEFLWVQPGAYIFHNTQKLGGPLLLASTLLFLVLATACANLGNLLLARSVTREREISIRAAIGANRGRIIRQLMTESILLALAGAVAGLALSTVTIAAVVRMMDLPSLFAVAPDWRVTAFAFGSALVASLLFGLAPALQATRANPRRGARLRLALIATQAAASCALLILSGLLTRGLQRANDTTPGFAYQESAVVDPNLSGIGLDATSTKLYIDELRTRLAGVNGVESTALATLPPLGYRTSNRRLPQGTLLLNRVDSRYFEAMKIPLLRGRTFVGGDLDAVILSERAATRLYPNQDPLGKEYNSGNANERLTVVGVAANAPITSPGDPDAMEAYFPMQVADQSAVIIVRTSHLDSTLKDLQRAANGIDRRVIPQVSAMRDSMARRISNSSTGAMAVALLGAVALALALVGFAGLISFAVTQRTREIGLRLALGATRFEVMRIGLDRMILPTTAGLIAGMAAASGLAYVMRAELYGLSSLDPVSFGLAPLLFLAFALLCSMGPLSRAARVDPATALRHE
jgi:predicted permease